MKTTPFNRYETEISPDSSANPYSLRNPVGFFQAEVCRAAFVKCINDMGIELSAQKQILDLGCGRGTWLRLFSEIRGTTEGLIGIDLTESRIEAARKINPEIRYISGDIRKLPFKDESLDMVTSFACLMFLKNGQELQDALTEIKRVLKKGGHCIIMEPSMTGTEPGLYAFKPTEMIAAAGKVQLKCTYKQGLFRRIGRFSTAYAPSKLPISLVRIWESISFLPTRNHLYGFRKESTAQDTLPPILLDGRPIEFSKQMATFLESQGIHIDPLPFLNLRHSPMWLLRLVRSRAPIVHYLQGHYPLVVYALPRLFGKLVIVHWIGTDVQYAVKEFKCNPKSIRLKYLRSISTHLTDFAPLQKELHSIGIHANVLPLAPAAHCEPPTHTEPEPPRGVFCYLPEKRMHFYRSDWIFEIAAKNPTIDFHISAHSGKGAPPLPNLHFYGWVENMESIWRKSGLLLRLTEHDGLSHTVIEALLRQKHVIWSEAFPHCNLAQTAEEANLAIQQWLRNPTPNYEGRNYALQHFTPDQMGNRYQALYRSELGRKKASRA